MVKGGTYGGVGGRGCARASGGGVWIVVGVLLLRAYSCIGADRDVAYCSGVSCWFSTSLSITGKVGLWQRFLR